MNRSQINAAIFDLGGVLIDWDPRHLYRSVFGDDAELERFLTEVCTLEWHLQHDAGRPMTETIPELVQLHPAYETHIRLWLDRCHEMIAGDFPETVAVLRDLHRQGVRLFVLSNLPAELIAVVESFPWMSMIEGAVFSAHERLVKPQPELFQIVLDRYHLEAERTLFVDDRPEHVAGAVTVGLRTHLFEGAGSLRRAISQLTTPQ